jgi:hypothetical protein
MKHTSSFVLFDRNDRIIVFQSTSSLYVNIQSRGKLRVGGTIVIL